MSKLAFSVVAFALAATAISGCDTPPTEVLPESSGQQFATGGATGTYRLMILGTLGGTYATANAINNAGRVVGYSEIAGASHEHHAFLWDRGNMNDLGTLGGDWSRAFDISHSGFVVGESEIAADGPYHAFLWRNGSMEDLGTLGGDYSSAMGVNDRGDVAGFSITSEGLPHATLWPRRGEAIDLGTLGGDWSYAEAVNNRGWVVGNSRVGEGYDRHAFLWTDGEIVDLGTLGGRESWALDINERGEVTGMALTSGGFPHAFVWTDGVMTDLGPNLSERGSHGEAVTNDGRVAGHTNAFAFPSQRAAVWTRTGVIDLPTPSWSNAHDINQRGQVVGYGGDGWPYQALLWQPRN